MVAIRCWRWAWATPTPCTLLPTRKLPQAEIGPKLEHHPLFPNRSNIEIVQRLADDADGRPHLRQRTWERGSGITQACGTGACAVAVAAILDKRISGDEAVIDLDGGSLLITWPGGNESVRMQGEAVIICTGSWPLADM